MSLFSRRNKAASRGGPLDRLIPVTADDLDEVTRICSSALSAAYGSVTETQVTRGGIVVRGAAVIGWPTQVMRTALEAVGYVLGDDVGRDGVVVIGWDPARYSGDRLTVARVDDRIDELLALRAQLLDSGETR